MFRPDITGDRGESDLARCPPATLAVDELQLAVGTPLRLECHEDAHDAHRVHQRGEVLVALVDGPVLGVRDEIAGGDLDASHAALARHG